MCSSKSAITILVLVFSSIFLILLSGLIGLVLTQLKLASREVAFNQALHIAEAGIDYYRWHLAHAPNDFQDGTGQPGPYIHEYKDPEGKLIGKFSLNIIPPTACEPAVIIESTGWTIKFPDLKRTIKVKYSKEALAKFAFLTNDDVWFGEDEELKGPFHSNGGIRMDGEQNSLATSAKETYICRPIHGCFYQQKPGIWGEGEGQEKGLWQFPVPSLDFNLISQDLAFIKEEAKTKGIYLSPTNSLGYHLVFKSNGTIDIFKVTKLKPEVWGYDGEKWVFESNDIESQTLIQNVPLPANCGPIFVEDKVWVKGDVVGRTTLAAAKFPELPQNYVNIIISGNINYLTKNSVLGLIAQKDILIPLYSPNKLEIKAVLLAQKGHVFRYYYPRWWEEPYRTYAIRDYIETYGALITNTVWTFTWVDWTGEVVSGYKETEMAYDSSLTFNPPPHFPTSGGFKIISWEEYR